MPLKDHGLSVCAMHTIVQWNLSNLDTNGAEGSVIVSEVSSFQRLKEWYLGWEKVSCLERCPQFKSVHRVCYSLCISVVLCISALFRRYKDAQVLNQISLRGAEYDSPVWELEERGEVGGGVRGGGGDRVLLNPVIDEDSEEEEGGGEIRRYVYSHSIVCVVRHTRTVLHSYVKF